MSPRNPREGPLDQRLRANNAGIKVNTTLFEESRKFHPISFLKDFSFFRHNPSSFTSREKIVDTRILLNKNIKLAPIATWLEEWPRFFNIKFEKLFGSCLKPVSRTNSIYNW